MYVCVAAGFYDSCKTLITADFFSLINGREAGHHCSTTDLSCHTHERMWPLCATHGIDGDGHAAVCTIFETDGEGGA
jgi:hypothetical protein